MTRFDNTFASEAAPELMAEFGEPITFFAAGGVGSITITAIVNNSAVDAMEEHQDVNVETATVSVMQADMTPADGDRFLRAGETANDEGYWAWTGELIASDGLMYDLKYSRPKTFRIGKR